MSNSVATASDVAERQEELDSASRRRSQRRRHKASLWVGRLLVVAVFLIVWEFASDRWIKSFWISRPTDVAAYLWEKWSSGVLPANIAVTLRELGIGYVLGAVVGLSGAMILSRFETLAEMADPFITALNGIPRIALAPLLIIWFGIGQASKIALVFSLVVFLVFYNTYAGVRNVPAELIRTAHSFGASRVQTHVHVELPAALPWILTGLKVGIPYGLIGAIVGEFIASSAGLGYMVQLESNIYNATGSIGVILVLTVIVMVLNSVVSVVERRLLRWRPRTSDGSNQMAL